MPWGGLGVVTAAVLILPCAIEFATPGSDWEQGWPSSRLRALVTPHTKNGEATRNSTRKVDDNGRFDYFYFVFGRVDC